MKHLSTDGFDMMGSQV